MYGEWAEEEVYLLSGLIEPGATVFDLGANVGTHTIALSRLVGSHGRVIAVDGQSRASALLGINIALNNATNVHRIEGVVSSIDSIVFEAAEQPLSDNFGAVHFRDTGNIRTTEPRRPIVSFRLDSLGYQKCDLIKADVEGMELDVFKGGWNLISKTRPAIYFEQNSDTATFPELFRMFSELGYRLFLHVANPFNARNFNACTENIFGGACETNILAIPAEKDLVLDPSINLREIGHEDFEIKFTPQPQGWEMPIRAYAMYPSL